jgi:hypothetical protein
MSSTNGFWTRIGDQALGLGMKRYVTDDVDKKPLWRFYITRHPDTKLIDVDANVADLREIIRQCEKSIEAIVTDGGRAPLDAAAKKNP